jgi:putative ABC transport system permease protein
MPSSAGLALRMLRGQASRAWLFAFCIGVGVAAKVSVGSFLASLDRSLAGEARGLLTADLEVSGGMGLSASRLNELRAALPQGSRMTQRMGLLTMASSGGKTRLVQLGAVAAEYPLVGTLAAVDAAGKAADPSRLQDGFNLWTRPELLTQLGLKVGDKLKLGKQDFTVDGIITDEPGLGGSAFSLGPRVLIGLNHIQATGLTGLGSRVSYDTLAAFPEAEPAVAEALAKRLREQWGLKDTVEFRGMPATDTVRLRTAKDAQGDVRRFFERLADFLGLVSLMALLLGGVGVASVTRGFVRQASGQLGLLRAVGATPRAVSALFAWQSAWLGLFGGLLGAAAGAAMQGALPLLLADFLPVKLQAVFSPAAILAGLGLGIFTALIFGLEPVLAAARQSPASLFRDEEPGSAPAAAWWLRLSAMALFGLLAALESHSWTRGPGFLGVLLLGAGLLQLAAALLLPRLAKLRLLKLPFAARHALANFGRAGLRPGATVVALGSAALLLGLLSVYQHSLLKELSPDRGGKALPDLFFIDVQADQVDPLKQFLGARPGLGFELSPMVKARYRGKLGAVEAAAGAPKTREQEDENFFRNREQNLSFRPGLSAGEKIVEGRWLKADAGPDDPVEASLEVSFAKRLDAKVGDTLRFDIQGVEIQARVTSLRKVNWASFQPNFFILLTPAALEGVPQTWIGSVSKAGDANQRGDLQAAMVQAFPNVTMFDVAEGTRKILGILDKISAAIRLMAWFCLATGLVVLAGLALATARSRRAEAALLKVLGAGRGDLLATVGIEFGILSALSAAGGLGLAVLFGWALMAGLLNLPFVLPAASLALLWLLFTFTGAATGLFASWRVYLAKPAEVLRED